jgi:energy-coupling factor transport system ATP-binding protein
MAEVLIKTEDLCFDYDDAEEGRRALDGVSLNIEEGSFVAVVGRNGSGKSTLAKQFNAILVPAEGKVFVKGLDTSDEANTLEVRRTVSMVFQNPDNQLVSSVVEDDVAFGPENLGVDPKEIRERVDMALKAVDMYEFRRKGPHQLSGGQKQRIAIAGALAMESPCIVFDEPTAMLDPSGRREIMGIIRHLHETGKTIVLITHFMEEAAQADRIIVMDKGRKLFEGTPEEVFSSGFAPSLPFPVEMAKLLGLNGSILTEEELIDAICS